MNLLKPITTNSADLKRSVLKQKPVFLLLGQVFLIIPPTLFHQLDDSMFLEILEYFFIDEFLNQSSNFTSLFLHHLMRSILDNMNIRVGKCAIKCHCILNRYYSIALSMEN